jgi:hypothetical protein
MARSKTTGREIETLLAAQAGAHRDDPSGRVAMRVRSSIARGARASREPGRPLTLDWRLWTGAGAALAASIGLAVALQPQQPATPGGPGVVARAAPDEADLGPQLLTTLLASAPDPLREEARALGTTAAELGRELMDRALKPARRLAAATTGAG